MTMAHYDILIVGGGAAGIAAAKAAEGASVLLVDRRERLGGILLQCAHRGFGDNRTGPEYARTLLQDFPDSVTLALNTTVLSVSENRTALLSGKELGRKEVHFSRLILAAGCREVPFGALGVGGTRPAGIYTAGQMQELMNLYAHVPQGPVVIIGSGDMGLILAAQLAERDIAVTLVEKKDSCGGMAKNQHRLRGLPVTILCGDRVTEVLGHPHITGCVTEKGALLPCKTLLVAAGLRPDRELAAQLGEPDWLHICGNCSKVHPMVEAVVQEGKQAGKAAYEHTR